MITTLYNYVHSHNSNLCICLKKMSLKVQVASHLRLLRVRCVWSAGDRRVNSIFYGVCVWWWSFMLRDWWEDGGKKKKKLQKFFVCRQTLWRRAKLACIKMWVNLGQGVFSKGKLNKTGVRVTKHFEV